ncbi:MAG: hypothetical protein ABTQ25_10545 [Nitrosomonas ureae]
MKRWQQDFVAAIAAGVPAEVCARRFAGLPLASVQSMRETEEEFGAAWDAVAPPGEIGDGLVATRVLAPATLEKLLWSHCSDEEAAAYFGLEVGEFKARVAGDAALSRVYKSGHLGGKAAIRVAQVDSALGGDKSMQTWLGKQYLAQAEKVENTVTVKETTDPKQLAKEIMFALAAGGQMPDIDGEVVVDLIEVHDE